MAVLEKAKSWRAGDPIPEVLRRFHHSAGDLPSPLDSYSLISSIENLDLLAALTVDQNADWRCREDAVTQGLYVGGPTRFFGLLRPRLTDAGVAHNSWYSELIERSSRPHVVVDALSISYSDMSNQDAAVVLDKITADLKRGEPWNSVYTRYAREFGYATGSRTKIGNLGHWVVFPDPALGLGHYESVQEGVVEYQGPPPPRRLWRLSYFDSKHLPALLKAHAGEVISLPSETYHEHVLYQIQEVYVGGNSAVIAHAAPPQSDCLLEEARTLTAIPKDLAENLARGKAGSSGIADANEAFNVTDVVDDRPRRRFVVGGVCENRALIAYENGGRAHTFEAREYAHGDNGWSEKGHWYFSRAPRSLVDLQHQIAGDRGPSR
jgi:hypothetical protein